MSSLLPTQVAPRVLLSLGLERTGGAPLHRQLYEQVRELILSGRLAVGARLPSSRMLARDLAVSRNTVMAAFDQLYAEGYIVSRVGSGAYVSSELPEMALTALAGRPSSKSPGARKRGVSGRGRRLATFPARPMERRLDDVEICRRAEAAGLTIYPLSMFHADPKQGAQGLLLGYTAVPQEQMDTAVARLAAVLG